jgi:hypothetical protein
MTETLGGELAFNSDHAAVSLLIVRDVPYSTYFSE